MKKILEILSNNNKEYKKKIDRLAQFNYILIWKNNNNKKKGKTERKITLL